MSRRIFSVVCDRCVSVGAVEITAYEGLKRSEFHGILKCPEPETPELGCEIRQIPVMLEL